MEISVAEYASREGVSERRVRQLASEGRIAARRVGRSWVIDPSGSEQRRAPVRPMSASNAEALARWLQGADVDPRLKHRFIKMKSRLSLSEYPDQLLRSWLAKRSERFSYSVQPDDLEELREDGRIQKSGVSSDAAGLLPGGDVEGYVSRADVDALIKDYLLVRSPLSKANVLLHVAEVDGDVPLAFVAADLADRGGARERQASRGIVQELMERD